jgi:uncharacterized protein YabN with tetrapyrrole methylase and pyrophosphatase domain
MSKSGIDTRSGFRNRSKSSPYWTGQALEVRLAVDQILEKLEEELAELRAELQAPDVDQRRVDEEVGDILFVVANLARRVGTEPETGLRAANRKFRRRFGHIEQRMAERGGEWREVTLATLDQFWEEAKRMERESLALEPTAEGKRLA